ncbi:MAG: septation ring formation regulator EzrA, partial [Erysipelotrichia bacterium]|nr:septation ring formation regulator EzrA [Erysipelotrichia bacterium]
EQVKEYQKQFDDVQEKLKEYSVLLAEIDDFVYSKKVKKANEKMNELNSKINDVENAVKNINDLLDEVLEQESTQRANINTSKNTFREYKKTLMENRGRYRQSVEYLDSFVSQIENMFSIFEEWMFASEFNKAGDKQQEIKESLADMKHYLEVLPAYYEKATIVLPTILDDVKLNAASCTQKGVYLDHLEVDKNIEIINDMLSDILMKLSKCNLERVNEVLEDCETRIKLLKEQVEKEETSFDVINTKVNALFIRIKDLNVRVQGIKDIYDKVHERFGFENLSNKLSVIDTQLDNLNEMRFKLESVIANHSVPFSTLVLSYNEVNEECEKLEGLAKELKIKLDNATSDEERAKKQLIKLQLIVNEMRIKIAKHRLPSVDEKYEEDIRNANVYIVDIKEILHEVPLNVEKLNSKLKEAIDYIYTLYNSVNNLVGMASMVENAILFGNKYRSDYSEIDSELTRAELCFSNGQYTKALKIAISAIERLHPGAYERLLSEGESANA